MYILLSFPAETLETLLYLNIARNISENLLNDSNAIPLPLSSI